VDAVIVVGMSAFPLRYWQNAPVFIRVRRMVRTQPAAPPPRQRQITPQETGPGTAPER